MPDHGRVLDGCLAASLHRGQLLGPLLLNRPLLGVGDQVSHELDLHPISLSDELLEDMPVQVCLCDPLLLRQRQLLAPPSAILGRRHRLILPLLSQLALGQAVLELTRFRQRQAFP